MQRLLIRLGVIAVALAALAAAAPASASAQQPVRVPIAATITR
jgi:hypothetical protein